METQDPQDQLFADATFDTLDLPSELLRAVEDLGFVRLTRVQDAALPLALAGRDVVAQAQTGSGKTAAYLLALFTRLLRVEQTSPPETARSLIVAPTRELAVQIAGDAESLGRYLGMRIRLVFGGVDYRKQRDSLADGADLLIGTPGRLIDYHKQGAYSLRDSEVVVIDECDRLFDMGFAEDLRWLLRRLPRPERRQSMMFSATLSNRVMSIGWRFMHDPVEVVVSSESLTPDTITQELYHVASREKLSLLLGLLRREGATRTMIFVNTRYQAQRLVDSLQRHGYQASGLTGNVVQTRRLRVLDDFRDGTLPILVGTDVASRGLHIEGVTHVINYDLPQDPEDYVHRIGRTARAGADGKAITLCCDSYVYSLGAIQRLVGYEIPVGFASEDLFASVKPARPRSRSGRSRRQQRPRSRADAQPAERSPAEGRKPASGEPPKRKPRRRRRRSSRGPEGGGGSGAGGAGGDQQAQSREPASQAGSSRGGESRDSGSRDTGPRDTGPRDTD